MFFERVDFWVKLPLGFGKLSITNSESAVKKHPKNTHTFQILRQKFTMLTWLSESLRGDASKRDASKRIAARDGSDEPDKTKISEIFEKIHLSPLF